VPPGAQVARPVEFRLARGGAVAGRISSRDDQPVLCGKVALVYTATEQSADFAPRGLTAETAGEGRYRIEGVPPGRYVLAAWGGSLPVGPANRFDAPRFVSDVEVREGETTVVDLLLASDRVLEGVVVDASGNPVAGADVELREELVLQGGDGGGSRFIFGEGVLRAFERRLLTELGYAPVLEREASSGVPIDPQRRYRYEPEHGPVPVNGEASAQVPADVCILSGQTLLDVARDDYARPQTRDEARALMRALIAERLPGQILHTRNVLRELQDL